MQHHRISILLFKAFIVAASQILPQHNCAATEPNPASIGTTIRAQLDELCVSLKVRDDLERRAVIEALKVKIAGSPDAVAVVLLRPAKEYKIYDMQVAEFKDQNSRIEWTRIEVPTLSKPLAVIVYTALKQDSIAIERSVLEAVDGKWAQLSTVQQDKSRQAGPSND